MEFGFLFWFVIFSIQNQGVFDPRFALDFVWKKEVKKLRLFA
jgi:hypothetical protein